jgi:hypothetical protein
MKNQKELQTQIQELNKRLENAKADRDVTNYTLKPYYLANEQYLFMLEEAQIELIKKLNQSLINKNK